MQSNQVIISIGIDIDGLSAQAQVEAQSGGRPAWDKLQCVASDADQILVECLPSSSKRQEAGVKQRSHYYSISKKKHTLGPSSSASIKGLVLHLHPDAQSLVAFWCTSIVRPIHDLDWFIALHGYSLVLVSLPVSSSSSAVHQARPGQECPNANLFHSDLLSYPTELLTLKSYVHLTKLSLQPTQSHCSLLFSLETKPTRADLEPKTLISTSTFDL
jgi:hypothetical protein